MRFPVLGRRRVISCLRKFGSMSKIAGASLEEIQDLGIAKNVAQTVKFSLAGGGVTPKHYQKGAT
jgi:excinuclease ABC subunit C